MGEQTKPLAGIRVLELGQLIAGPFAGKVLAEFDADVNHPLPVACSAYLRDKTIHPPGSRERWSDARLRERGMRSRIA